MIEAHLLDSWTRFPDRQTRRFALGDDSRRLRRAAVSVPRRRRGRALGRIEAAADRRSSSGLARGRPARARDLRPRVSLQDSGLGARVVVAARRCCKVDILNIMGPSIMAAAAIWGAVRTVARRAARHSPPRRSRSTLRHADRPQHVRFCRRFPMPSRRISGPSAGLSNFVFFPWAGFVFAGAIVGRRARCGARDALQEQLANLAACASAAPALAVAAYELSFFPTWYPQSHFWTTSPAFFFMRLGIMTAAIGFAYVWRAGRGGADESGARSTTGPDVALHLLDSRRDGLRAHLAAAAQAAVVAQAWFALAIFCVFMLICSIFKDRSSKVEERSRAQASRLRVQARAFERASRSSCLSPEP